MKTILVIDNDKQCLARIRRRFEGAGVQDHYATVFHEVETDDFAAELHKALAQATDLRNIDGLAMVIADIVWDTQKALVDRSGFEFLRQMAGLMPEVPRIAMTQHFEQDGRLIVQACTSPAVDVFIPKNFLEDASLGAQDIVGLIPNALARRGPALGVPVAAGEPDVCDVCIFTATEIEYRHLHHIFLPSERPSGYEFRATVGSVRVVGIRAHDQGMAASAIASTRAILRFRPKLVVMCGVCGGVQAEGAHIGQLVVGDPVWDYGRGKLTETGFAIEPRQRRALSTISKAIVSRALLDELPRIREAFPSQPPIAALTIHIGPMGTGAAVVDSPSVVAEIKEQHRKLLAIEMEAFAVMEAAENALDAPIPAFVLKGFSDLADGTKDAKYQDYCSFASASVLHFLIKSGGLASVLPPAL